ncbi:MAG: SAM-dependent methyltransferase [Legionellales bacterium]|nr:SAM-dependent methyltransferase [Legionellales bacterium]|tara:strand:- start:11385 stop:12569 length:1185 start_codon:yes stop_codon:yes gene_type:complete
MNSSAPDNLPEPSAEALAHSAELQTLIVDTIGANGGTIPFSQFMEMALYAPNLGYYTSGQRIFGKHGDFHTAPEISPLFSLCLANQCQQVLQAIDGDADILEFGGGNGTMAADILLSLEAKDSLPAQYYILDLSTHLQQQQRATIQHKCPHLLNKVTWLQQLPEQPINGVVLANEVLDAMPVRLLQFQQDSVKEYMVDDSLQWQLEDITDLIPEITHVHECLSKDCFARGYQTEINPLLTPWIKSISDCLNQGLVLLIDYGYPAREYYHPSRYQGTLMCHYQQRAHTDPLLYPGLQDITAHVDFTAVANAAFDNGFHVAGFTPQASFLTNCGILECMANSVAPADTAAHYTMTQAVKYLLLPSEMGEIFKAMALTKAIELDLIGFRLQDCRMKL